MAAIGSGSGSKAKPSCASRGVSWAVRPMMSTPLHQAMKGKGVRFDARKFNWLGSTGASNEVVYVWHTAGARRGRPFPVPRRRWAMGHA